MTISVCIPTYNSARFVRECIESVLAQTRPDFELIVSDDASTDNTCEIVRSFCDSRIRLVRLERNRGMAFNWNHAVSLAQGQYVKVLCQDDLLDATCLEEQAALLERHPEMVLATSERLDLDGAGRTLHTTCWFAHETILGPGALKAAVLVYGNIVGPPSAVLIRRQSLLQAGPFSDDLPQALDVDMWLRLAAIGSVGYLPRPLSGFRLHREGATYRQQRSGLIPNDVSCITERALGSLDSSFLARRICWGRVAGSFVKHALFGLGHGYIKWPLATIWRACSIDPGFLGLLMHQLLLRPGLLGLRVEEERLLKVVPGGTLPS